MFGIDVSLWQRDIDFEAAKREGAEFVIIKSSEGSFVDPCFDAHYKAAKAAGLHVGAYHYLTSRTVSGAEGEAKYFASLLAGKQLDMPVYLDIESPVLFLNPKGVNTEIARKFCDVMEKQGFFAGIYTYADFLSYNLDDSRLQGYAHWIGCISKEKPAYKGNAGVFGIWQFGGDRNLIRSNKVGGVVCDQDYCYIDYPAKIKKHYLNGYKPEQVAKSVAPEIKPGDLVSIAAGAVYTNGVPVPPIVTKQKWYVLRTAGSTAVLDSNEAGTMRILSSVGMKYLGRG